MNMDLKKAWDSSYQKKDNYLFYPSEDVVRFFNSYINKKIGISTFESKNNLTEKAKVLDVGCGIGRHLIYIQENNAIPFGIDLSNDAIDFAKKWFDEKGLKEYTENIKQGSITEMPFESNYFDFAISHGVLDSMPLDIAKKGFVEIAKVLKQDAYFYCDLISGDDINHDTNFSGEEIVLTEHEKNTIQLYYNLNLINECIENLFNIESIILKKDTDLISNKYFSRYHLVLKKN